MEGAILLLLALGGLAAFGVGVILLVLYWRSGRPDPYAEPTMYGNLVQCPRCNYMNPVDSAACLNCQLPFTHPRRPYQPPVSPTYPTLPPHHPRRAASPPNAPTHYAPAPPPAQAEQHGSHQDQTVAQAASRTPPMPRSPVAHPHEASSPPPPRPARNRPPGMPHAWLEGVDGIIAGQQTVLIQTDTLFGRSTQCDVQIYDQKVSRKHFIIRYGNGAFFLQDQGSSRGTLVNGEKVTARRLNDGDHIEVGDAGLVFHVEA